MYSMTNNDDDWAGAYDNDDEEFEEELEPNTKGLKRNPRANVPEEKWCKHIYPDDHATRPKERCGSVSMKNSKFCYYHQPDQDKMMEQLADAREARENPPNMKHGFYSADKRQCDSCTLAGGCKHFVEGKKVCDFSVNQDIDLSDLENIQKHVEEIMVSEMGTYRLLGVIVEQYSDNAELMDLKRRYGNTIVKNLKDFASLKAMYEKNTGKKSFKDVLLG